jgi:uncharacterized protein YdiU (UPF0061 family)
MFYDGRSQLEPGAIVCRAAPSFIRFGSFELPSSRGDLDLLGALTTFTIRRDFPELVTQTGVDDEVRAEWFAQVCERTARMVAAWMRVGFVHGVMNTDNMSVLGLTIDYGPYGWIDNFDPHWTPNTTDAGTRRYRFGQQPAIAHWNLARFASSLVPVFGSTDPLQAGLERFVSAFEAESRWAVAGKLGLRECADDDLDLMDALYGLLQEWEVDMTLFFRHLADVDPAAPALAPLRVAFYDPEKMARAEGAFAEWLERYVARVRQEEWDPETRRARMQTANPRYVLRNYLAQEAIDRATAGDETGIARLLDVLRRPYEDQPGAEAFTQKRPDWARSRPGCSMLSCSS